MNTDRPSVSAMAAVPACDADAYEAGLRAGYAHGYDVGLEHGRVRAEADLDLPAADPPRTRLSGPNRDELISRGYIPVDRTRPPALPARLWTAQDWAEADERDLPTTEHGRAQWQTAFAAGRVPASLASAYAEARAADVEGRVTAEPGHDLAADLARDVADTAQVVAELRARLDRAGAAGRCRTDQAPWRGSDVTDVVEAGACETGIGR